MRVFLDTSAYAKRYVIEDASTEVDQCISSASSLHLSILCVPELFSALNRKIRENELSRKDYRSIRERIAKDVVDVDIVEISSPVINGAVTILEKSPVRALDALQIASALECRAEAFVTCDRRQCSAAERAGLRAILL